MTKRIYWLSTLLVAGALFALGLGISGMTQPAKVVNFLDFTGNWDPSLAFVMVGAVTVHFILFRVIIRRPSPLLSPSFSLPTTHAIDARLVIGAAMFGAGWGLSGFCPGPAVTSLVTGDSRVIWFVAAMLVGMVLHGLFDRWLVSRKDLRATGEGDSDDGRPSLNATARL